MSADNRAANTTESIDRAANVTQSQQEEMSRSLLNYVGPTLPNDCYAALVTWATGLIAMRSC